MATLGGDAGGSGYVRIHSSTVLMRNFPSSWVEPSAVAELPNKVSKILSRFGRILRPPEVTSPPGSQVEATATFAELEMAQAAVQTLHGVDMRSETEKQQAAGQPPRDSERFWAQLMDQTGPSPWALAPARDPVPAPAPAPAPAEPPAAAAPAPEPHPEASHVFVQGFPASWAESQLRFLFVAFGGASRIQIVADAQHGRAACVQLKDPAALPRAAEQLNDTKVGDGDVIEECRILCRLVLGEKERRQQEEAAAAAAAAAARAKAERAAREAEAASKEQAAREAAAQKVMEAAALKKRLAKETADREEAEAAEARRRQEEAEASAAAEAARLKQEEAGSAPPNAKKRRTEEGAADAPAAASPVSEAAAGGDGAEETAEGGEETEDSDYDPFAAETNEPDYDPFAAAPAGQAKEEPDADAVTEASDDEDGGGEDAFNALIEMMRAQEATPQPSSAAQPTPEASGQPAHQQAYAAGPGAPASYGPGRAGSRTAAPGPRMLDTGEEDMFPKKGKTAPQRVTQNNVEYVFNQVSQRWEAIVRNAPQAATPGMAPSGAGARQLGGKAQMCRNFTLGTCAFGSGCSLAHSEAEMRGAAGPGRPAGGPWGGYQAPPAQPAQPRQSHVVAECEAEARADERGGKCEFAQALAVRLALRFESRPADILSAMAEAGLPAAKDQRSTVKALMRLCHPDKCKHPDAKRAMQIIQPLLKHKG